MPSSVVDRRLQRVSIVTPFHNEEGSVAPLFRRLNDVLEPLCDQFEFEFVCVNDGSGDATLRALKSVELPLGYMRLVDLSRNFGKEAALTAGIDLATGAAVIPLDADLQDPPELIPEMIRIWQEGALVVLAQRKDRHSEGLIKRATASAFYSIHNRLASTPIPPNVGDFRLMDRQVVDAVRRMPERQRFMKGLLAWTGFPSQTVEYTRAPRSAGKSQWTYPKLLGLAAEGITSFSTAPLRLASIVGATFALLAIGYAAYLVLRVLIYGIDVPGYASLFAAVVFMGGIQLLCLGVLGEYVGRTYIETKQRPVYVIRQMTERCSDSRPPEGPTAGPATSGP